MLTMGSESPHAIARLFAWVNGISKCELIELKDLSLNDRIELGTGTTSRSAPSSTPDSQAGQGGKGHDFQPCSYTQITWCDLCGEFIWGLYKQSLNCASVFTTGIGAAGWGMKCRTSFYLPKDTAKHLHIGSRTQVREVIEALLNKFTVVDNPAKFALFERRERQNQSSVDGDPTKEGVDEQSLARLRSFQRATPFVFTRQSSLYFDEDGDLAHEFYEETVVTKNGRKRAKLKKIQKNLIPQGTIKLEHPCIHVDFPVVLCEV